MKRAPHVCNIIFLILLNLVLLNLVTPARSGQTYYTYTNMVMASPVVRGVEIWPGMAVVYQDELQGAYPHIVKTYLKWSDIETVQGVYRWDAAFDADYSIILVMGAAPWVVLKMSPAWARADPRECGRITNITAFAEFARAVALRYPRILHYEVWNEPDTATSVDGYFGCWGNAAEYYYGGAYYATVINPVRQAIKQASPQAQVYFGGLMLPSTGPMSQYFEGAIKAGAEFDGVAFHFYAWYSTGQTSPQEQVALLRQVMTKYNRTRPIMLSETSMLYESAGEPYETAQADYLSFISREVDRLDIQGFIWYALPDTGWNHSGMMEGNRRKPVLISFSSYDAGD